mmetsp:Transcript_5128/g.16518  ORF Transcript_5128/g.16518 Transcript_5128/m.16518 type:complete len:210 (+) Transcript_5128:440-1069(+)
MGRRRPRICCTCGASRLARRIVKAGQLKSEAKGRTSPSPKRTGMHPAPMYVYRRSEKTPVSDGATMQKEKLYRSKGDSVVVRGVRWSGAPDADADSARPGAVVVYADKGARAGAASLAAAALPEDGSGWRAAASAHAVPAARARRTVATPRSFHTRRDGGCDRKNEERGRGLVIADGDHAPHWSSYQPTRGTSRSVERSTSSSVPSPWT